MNQTLECTCSCGASLSLAAEWDNIESTAEAEHFRMCQKFENWAADHRKHGDVVRKSDASEPPKEMTPSERIAARAAELSSPSRPRCSGRTLGLMLMAIGEAVANPGVEVKWTNHSMAIDQIDLETPLRVFFDAIVELVEMMPIGVRVTPIRDEIILCSTHTVPDTENDRK